MKRFSKLMALLLGYQVLAVQGGCASAKPAITAFSRPLVGINRVVFMELGERNSLPGIAKDMTVALSHAVRMRGLFGLEVIDRQDPIYEAFSLDGRGAVTLEQIRKMRQTFKCDGILLGSISDFRPHPRMQLGLSLRMLDLKRGRLVWAIDHVWDTTDKAVEERTKHFFSDQMRSAGYEPMGWQLAMVSPKVFEKFIAYEVAETLSDPADAKAGQRGKR